nr:MAG: hypothetical protein [Caudoviricetes sp.]
MGNLYRETNITGTEYRRAKRVEIDLANTQLWLMRSQHAANQFTNGKISVFSVYSKALSATEIQQNFNATRSRYGI